MVVDGAGGGVDVVVSCRCDQMLYTAAVFIAVAAGFCYVVVATADLLLFLLSLSSTTERCR